MRPLFGQETAAFEADNDAADPAAALTDGALDTLGFIFQTFGATAFSIDTELNPQAFAEECLEIVRHIENGEAIPTHNIGRSESGSREWPLLRHVFNERRRAEQSFVVERIGGYRELVDDLIAGLRRFSERDAQTELQVTQSLQAVDRAIATGEIQRVRDVLRETMETVSTSFETQRQAYETQLQELNERMGNLRQDLLTAREEMQRDSLTDAYNRGAFDAALEQNLNLCVLSHQPTTLVMIDLDNFKDVNDSYGHAVGDQALRTLGECLARAFIRKSDFVARYGGDEFAVILQDTNQTSAKRLVEHFIANVGRAEIQTADGTTHVTCSAGYTELLGTDTAERAIARADIGLYAVKARGGNAAEYTPPPTD